MPPSPPTKQLCRREAARSVAKVHGQVSWFGEYNTSSGHMVMFPFDVPRLLLALNQTYSNMYQYIIVSQALCPLNFAAFAVLSS